MYKLPRLVKGRNVPGHEAWSLEDPEQAAPPFRGAGLLHFLVLVFFPVWLLQELQDPHALHPPFTTREQNIVVQVKHNV